MPEDFSAKSICILGRQPALGLAELESLYGSQHVVPGPAGTALLDIDGFEINFKKLGGTIKVGRILAKLPGSRWPQVLEYLRDKIPEHLKYIEEGKFTLGASLYGLDVGLARQNRDLLDLKRSIKESGRSARLVPNKAPALSSAQVLHNKLTHRGAWELLIIKDGAKAFLAQTLFVQDIDAYSARDQARPARDARIGMLPPKLAQIILNLARPAGVVLDPFCGSGVVLQEALLMGYEVIGTDIEPRMVDFAKKNLDWLSENHELPKYTLGQADATDFKWPKFDAIASEVYLGRPLSKLPDQAALSQIISDVNAIAKKFLNNVAPQLKSGHRLCLAVPAWIDGKKIIHLPLLANLTDMGYNRYDFVRVRNDDLVYFREGQIVARELLVLTKV